jgi:TatD DNase family protein
VKFTDTHCHIHEESYEDREAAYERALQAGVGRIICVGTDISTSKEAVKFALTHDNAWAIIGIHPHEAKHQEDHIGELRELLEDQASRKKIVGIGEIGLDYFYTHSPREVQITVLKQQIDLAKEFDLPISFHVREAFDDFWPIFGSYEALRGVLHSYTDNLSNLHIAVSHGLYIGVNGISTFAKDKTDVYRAIPLENILLETDAPFLTPVPLRGKVNEPAFVTHVAQYIANLQSINLEELSRATERNATTLFITNN